MNKIWHFSEEDKALNRKLYDEYFEQFHWVDGWDRGSKYDNFERMMHLVDLTGFPISGASCLDVGCGTGDLSLFLRKRGCRRYVGLDIYEPALNQAREKYADELFIEGDLLAGVVKGRFDYVFASGMLTIKLETIDNYDFLTFMVDKMWRFSRVGIVFNILTTDPEPDPDLFFYDTERVFAICRKIAPKAFIEIVANEDKEQAHVYMWR